MRRTAEENKDNGKRRAFNKKDPLVVLGIAVMVVGVILLTYGLTPFNTPTYNQVANGTVPLYDNSTSTDQFITPDLAPAYFVSHYSKNATGPIDKVECTPSPSGYDCIGLEITGSTVQYDVPVSLYGLVAIAFGALSVFAGYVLLPSVEKKPYLRPIKVRVDEAICVANSVCIRVAPTVFQLREQKEASLFAPLAYVVDPHGADNDTILLAAERCPTGAIIVEDAETGEQIWPIRKD